MDIFAIIIFWLTIFYFFWKWLKNKNDIGIEHEKELGTIIDESLYISPQIKESLKQFSIQNASELRAMNSQELIQLLSCCANALRVFEKRVERISEGYAHIEYLVIGNAPSLPMNRAIHIKATTKRLEPHKLRLDEEASQVLATFDTDLKSEGSILNVIPEKYRLSIILDMMCEYLSDGEVDSWEGCIKSFKDDFQRIQEMEYFQKFADSLERVEKNTALIAFFSGITALNTGRIASKL